MNAVVRISDFRRKPYLHFTRTELNRLLRLYTNRVISGEWRDYAISFAPGMASFFIFRHTHENPLFVISKLGGKAERKNQGRYVVMSRERKLRQGQNLDEVLDVFDQPLRLVTG